MDPERWNRVQRLFHRALDEPEERREAFVKAACAGDAGIEADVFALLDEDRAGDSLLDRGIARVADAVLDGSNAVPDTIGPYRLIRLLGEGGMGVVYLGRRDDVDGVAAIKFLRDARLSPHRRERFLQEQRFLAGLSHPAICRLYDAGVLADGTPYFVMEYCDGRPITDYCEHHGLSVARRLRLFRQVCEAVQYAHRQALIHRDLKPTNILAFGDVAAPTVKLLDFGIAKRTEAGAEPDSRTKTAFGIMTPAYASPEQLRGEGVGVSTDVYSLGVLLYEMLTGSLPFDLSEQTPYEAARTITAETAQRPSVKGFARTVGRRSWSDLDVLCMTAMHKDADRRYPTVEALLRDVDHYLDGEALEARPDSFGYRLGKFVRRNRRAVAAAGVVTATIAALVVFYTIRLSNARNAALAEAARTQRVQRFLVDLFEGGDVFASPREGLLVTTLIERGVREARALDGEPAIQAELYQTLGGVYQRMADFDRAEELLRSALEQRRQLLGDDHPDVGESLMTLGLVAAERGELDEAERQTREALKLIRAGLPPRHPRVAEALTALGSVLVDRGRTGAAIGLLEQAVEINEGRDDPTGLMMTLRALANAHWYAGDYETSDAINRRLLELTERQLGANHPSYATCLINLAGSRRWLGYVEEAERLYREALVINESHHGRRHPTVASNLGLIGACLTDRERYDEARTFIDEALELREAVYGPRHYEVALTLNQRARNELASGDLEAAEASFARELDIYRATVGDEHPSTATGLSNVASIQFRRGRQEEAEQTMRRALATFEAALRPDHVDIAIARVKLGRLLAARKRYREALEQLTLGYELLSARASPSLSWIDYARSELATVYEALGDPARAAEFRGGEAENGASR